MNNPPPLNPDGGDDNIAYVTEFFDLLIKGYLLMGKAINNLACILYMHLCSITFFIEALLPRVLVCSSKSELSCLAFRLI